MDTSDADLDNEEQSDSTLPSINILSERQGHRSSRGTLGSPSLTQNQRLRCASDSLDSFYEDPDPIFQLASPTLNPSRQNIYPVIASLPQSTPTLSGFPSTPQADDATQGCETESRVCPRAGEPDHTRSTVPASNTHPATPEAGSRTATSSSRRLSWVSSQADDATRSHGGRSEIIPGSDKAHRSHSSMSAASTHPETPKAGSPTPTSPSRPRRRGIGMETDTACVSEAASPQGAVRSRGPRERRMNLRRTSQRRSKNIGAYMNSDPAASSDADSDSTASVSVMRHAKIPDDEEFQYLSWVWMDTLVVTELMSLMWSWTRLPPSAARVPVPS